ncbi:MAG: OmpA family protein [Myxococcales bacterium]|nr:OmpA family protein [Myxococcales bacterium]
MRSIWMACTLALTLSACGGTQKPDTLENEDESEEGSEADAQKLQIIEYEKKAAALVAATEQLGQLQGQLDEQQRRLSIICADYPDHDVCQPHTAAAYAREAFCADPEFTQHVDEVVNACHQGECKQVDQAAQISRAQYMLLTQRLPHTLVTFNAARTALDRNDQQQLQRFLEVLQGEKGYVIIVGRASKDGNWRKNIEYAVKRAESTRKYLVDQLGIDPRRVGFITYGHEKMYLTALDAERLSEKKMSVKQANRSALVFSYPCFDVANAH